MKVKYNNSQLITKMIPLIVFCIFSGMLGCESEFPIQTEPVESVTTDLGELTGTVQPTESLVVLQRNGVDFRSTIADDEGKWKMSELPKGNYSLYVVASGYFTDISRSDITVEVDESFDVGTIALRPYTEAATIIGKVTNTDGEPLPNSEINIICVTGICAPVKGSSDSDGNFSIQLWSGLAGKVNIKTQDYRPTSIRVKELPPRQTFDLGAVTLQKDK